MKQFHIWAAALCLLSASCSDIRFGDDFLGDHPENSGATLDEMFSSAVNADRVLAKAYTYLPYGLPTGDRPYDKLGVNILEAITDLHYSFRNNMSDGPVNLYYNGTLSSNIGESALQGREAYRFGAETEYNAIRYAWIYIENADRIPDITASMRNQRIAEAKMIIALSYAEMLRYMGGVPLLKHAVDANETMHYPRNTFAQTVDYIVQLLDEAAPALVWKASDTDNGRMTKAGALALKLRVLLFAASPTFNSASPYHPQANEYVCYGNYDRERWNRAIEAAKEFFEELDKNKQYELTQPADNTATARQEAFRSGYFNRNSSEVLISTRRGYNNSVHDDFYKERNYSGPTLNYVNMFPWADGSDFPEDFNWENPPKQPFFTADGTPTRDPRLYETCVVPGDTYYDGTLAPLYTNHLNYVSPSSGFFQMKFILRETNDRSGQPAHWPYLRLSEALLSYAEAINEYVGMPNSTAYECVNQIRRRVGLPDLETGMDQLHFREAVLRERALELGFEEVRWFDLIRWGREEDFRKPLYGLSSTGNNSQSPTAFSFKPFQLDDRTWRNVWDTKWYLAPVPLPEINKGYGMTQNPGW